MRKLYIICFVTLTTLFITCYYIGYCTIVRGSREVESARDYYEVRQAGAVEEAVVRRDTDIVVEEYDINTHTTESYTIVPSIDVLGLNRAAYAETLRRYMEDPEDEQRLLETMREQLKYDPMKAAAIDITSLGLMEVTRKKQRKTLKEQAKECGIL